MLPEREPEGREPPPAPPPPPPDPQTIARLIADDLEAELRRRKLTSIQRPAVVLAVQHWLHVHFPPPERDGGR